jgi:hypothetical protein
VHARSRIFVACGLALLAAPAAASDLGADGRIHFAADALLQLDFEDAQATASRVRLVKHGSKTWTYQMATADALAPLLTAGEDALEGHGGLRLGATDGAGLAVVVPDVFGRLTGQKVIVSAWGRAEGMEPYLAVTYGNDIDISTSKMWAWARIPAVRTGRETSDGWVEYSTGPIDGAVLDRPIHDLVLSARYPTDSDTFTLWNGAPTDKTGAVSFDAVEIVAAEGTPASGTCTAATIDAACGPAADCVFGRCVDAAVSWHPVPPMPMQQEIVARVAHLAEHFLGDRAAAARVDDTWAAQTLALASADATPRSFWSGLNQQFLAIRDSHTHLGSPYAGMNTPFAARPSTASGPLDICFGPTLDDLGDGKLAYVIWRLGTGAPTAFKVGDVLASIDGMDPKAWVDLVEPRYVEALPIVAGVEWAPSARYLASLIAAHAQTITLRRCAAGSCTEQPPIDVPTLSLQALSGGQYAVGTVTCTPRLTDVVAGDRADSSGGDLLVSAALDSTTVGIEFDGFDPSDATAWRQSLDAAFVPTHDRLIVDARQGHGGKNALGDYMVQQFRSTADPAVLVLAARSSFDALDDPSLFAFDWTGCATKTSNACALSDIFIYQPTTTTPPALASKVAWLDTDDISNNDMVPRVIQGRANVRVFGPFPSYGALGSDVNLPPLMPNWHSGTIAASDGRYGTSIAAAEATTCESGHGVVPDQVVTQTLSDVLSGKDTIVEAAKAWLGP